MLKCREIQDATDRVRELIREMDRPRLQVREIMSGLEDCLTPGTKVREAKDILERRRRGAALVLQNGECVGLISEAELLKARSESQLNSPVTALMRRDIPVVKPEQGVQEVLSLFSDMEVAILPVLEKEILIGVLTRSDLLLQLYQNF
jgi:tRNA nucleotidyltransferase (CCA-adding enzyme)